MTGLVSMRVIAAGTRLQLPHTFNQAAGGPACRTPKSSPEQAAVRREKSFSPDWVGRRGRKGRKRPCLSDGERGAGQGRAASVPGEGKWVPTQCPEHPAGEKARTGALQTAVSAAAQQRCSAKKISRG